MLTAYRMVIIGKPFICRTIFFSFKLTYNISVRLANNFIVFLNIKCLPHTIINKERPTVVSHHGRNQRGRFLHGGLHQIRWNYLLPFDLHFRYYRPLQLIITK